MNKVIIYLIGFSLITAIGGYIYKLKYDNSSLEYLLNVKENEVRSLESIVKQKTIEFETLKSSHEVTLKALEEANSNKTLLDDIYNKQSESLSNIQDKDYMSTIVPPEIVDFLNNTDKCFRDPKNGQLPKLDN